MEGPNVALFPCSGKQAGLKCKIVVLRVDSSKITHGTTVQNVRGLKSLTVLDRSNSRSFLFSLRIRKRKPPLFLSVVRIASRV